MSPHRTTLFLLALAGCGTAPPFAQEDLRPGGSIVATPEGTGVLLRRTDTDAPVRTLSGGHDAPVLAVHFSDAGDRLVSGDERGRIVVWNPEDGSVRGKLPGHRGAIRQFATRARAPDLASASDDGTIKLWDLPAPRQPDR